LVEENERIPICIKNQFKLINGFAFLGSNWLLDCFGAVNCFAKVGETFKWGVTSGKLELSQEFEKPKNDKRSIGAISAEKKRTDRQTDGFQ
jgi:hypothetical protein